MSINTEFKMKTYLLKNANGLTLHLINYGGRITNLEVPDRNGNLEDKRAVWLNALCARFTIADVGWNKELVLTAFFHKL